MGIDDYIVLWLWEHNIDPQQLAFAVIMATLLTVAIRGVQRGRSNDYDDL